MKDISLQDAYRPLLPDQAAKRGAEEPGAPVSFGQVLQHSLNQVNRAQKASDEATKALATGQGVDIHQAMIAMEKASVSFQFMMQVRNKIIAAYDEIRRMQL